MPKTETQAKEEASSEKKVDIASVLKSKDWKKDNCSLIQPKKELNNDLFVPTKNKKQKKHKKQDEKDDVDLSLNHKIDVLGFFDSLKISPPMFTSRLEETVKQLSEKQKYFENLNPEETENQEKDNHKKREKYNKNNMQPKAGRVNSFIFL